MTTENESQADINQPRSLLARNSKFVPERYFDEDRNMWRVRIKSSRTKFDDEAKEVFLDEYRQHGRMGDSARAAGVTCKTVRDHLTKDEEFGIACMEAEEEYKGRLIKHHQRLIFEGTEKVNYDRNGNITSTEQIYPIRLIELELKKHDEGYRDKKEVKMDVTGGVMVAPAEVKSVDDWESRFSSGQTIDGDATVVEDAGQEGSSPKDKNLLEDQSD